MWSFSPFARLAGLADTLAPLMQKPVLCSVTTGITAVVAASQRFFQKPESGSFALPPPLRRSVSIRPARSSVRGATE